VSCYFTRYALVSKFQALRAGSKVKGFQRTKLQKKHRKTTKWLRMSKKNSNFAAKME
jgi:hypothetical protein